MGGRRFCAFFTRVQYNCNCSKYFNYKIKCVTSKSPSFPYSFSSFPLSLFSAQLCQALLLTVQSKIFRAVIFLIIQVLRKVPVTLHHPTVLTSLTHHAAV